MLLHVITEVPQWLQQRERLVVLARAQGDPALSQTGQRAQPVIGLGIGNFDGDCRMCQCLVETPPSGVPHGKERRRATPRPASGELHCDRRQVLVRGDDVPMTRQEFDLLFQLATHPDIVFSRAALLQNVWQEDTYVTERTVDTVISRLRRKVERNPHEPEMILTAWGAGYKFATAGSGCGSSTQNSVRPGSLAT